MLDSSVTVIERAYALARTGKFVNLSEIAKALRSDGFSRGHVEDHLSGKAIKRELRGLCQSGVLSEPQH